MKQKLTDLYAKNGTKKVLASLLSILAGLLLGSIVVIIVGLAEQKITTAGMWEGVRLIFAGILGWGLIRGRSYLKYLMGEMLPMDDEGWMIFTRRWAYFFLFMAVLNEVIWRTHTTEIWVYFKTFGLTAAIFLFFMTQGRVFKRYSIAEDEGEGEA